MWYVLILSDTVFPSHPPSSRSGEKMYFAEKSQSLLFMHPRKLHRKWLGFAIFRLAWGAASHRVFSKLQSAQKTQ